MPKLQEIINILENFAPLNYQESYDNSGLIVGDLQSEINGAIIALDCLESVVDEAIEKKCNLIIAHHPIVFAGLKSFTGKNYIEKVIIKAIKNDIAIYVAHTNADNIFSGVNHKIAEKLNLIDVRVLAPKNSQLKHLFVYVPHVAVEAVRNALFTAGAGQLGDYSNCSFNVEGFGTFFPSENAHPAIGEKNELHREAESKIEVVFSPEKEQKILRAMKAAHPYEEIAFGILNLENQHPYVGAGLVGDLQEAMSEIDFFRHLQVSMNTKCIRHTEFLQKSIKRVAVCGGSGSFLLPKALSEKADIFITADYKYHQFFDAEHKIIIADIGHFESEQYTGEIFYEVLSKKFPNFALHLTSVNTNPIKYFI